MRVDGVREIETDAPVPQSTDRVAPTGNPQAERQRGREERLPAACHAALFEADDVPQQQVGRRGSPAVAVAAVERAPVLGPELGRRAWRWDTELAHVAAVRDAVDAVDDLGGDLARLLEQAGRGRALQQH